MPKLRTILRRVFNIAAVISLLLCVATAVFWIRSFYFGRTNEVAAEEWMWSHAAWNSTTSQLAFADWRFVSSASSSAGIFVEWGRTSDPSWSVANLYGSRQYGLHYTHSYHITTFEWQFFGRGLFNFQWHHPSSFQAPGKSAGAFYVMFPFWVPLLLFAVMPSIWVIRLGRKRRRAREGLCAQCGYDLRGNPAAGTCPECGEAVAAAGKATDNTTDLVTAPRPRIGRGG